jgi:tripartite-type tricarboxylate transporter receptor subunit TctC
MPPPCRTAINATGASSARCRPESRVCGSLHNLNYDALADFAPVCYLTRTPAVIAVSSASPYRTLADLIGAARARPGDGYSRRPRA